MTPALLRIPVSRQSIWHNALRRHIGIYKPQAHLSRIFPISKGSHCPFSLFYHSKPKKQKKIGASAHSPKRFMEKSDFFLLLRKIIRLPKRKTTMYPPSAKRFFPLSIPLRRQAPVLPASHFARADHHRFPFSTSLSKKVENGFFMPMGEQPPRT